MLIVSSAFFGCSLTGGTMVILFINLIWRTIDFLMSILKSEVMVSDVIIFIIFGGCSVLGMIGIFVKIPLLLIPFMVVQFFCLVVMIILMIAFPFNKEFMLNELQPEAQPKVAPTEVPTKVPTKIPIQVSTAVPTVVPTEVPISTIVLLETMMAIGCIVFFYTIIVVLSCYNEMKEKNK